MSFEPQTPDLKWYGTITESKRLKDPRCPFASVDSCPRFYQSLSLLGTAGSTAIEPREGERLLKKWKAHHLWPRTAEHETSIMSSGERPHIYSRFCPEVSHEAFGIFTSSMSRYADEIDSEAAHKALSKEGTPANDWRWSWSQVTP